MCKRLEEEERGRQTYTINFINIYAAKLETKVLVLFCCMGSSVVLYSVKAPGEFVRYRQVV